MKESLDALAVLGGDPVFTTPRPVGQLTAPDIDDYLGILRKAFEIRWLANGGPIVKRLERRLAEFHGTAHCVAVANAGLGIIMLLSLFAGPRRGRVIMPAFSYRGLPHFARWAGQTPRFCDVEPATQALDPQRVAEALGENVTAILAVGNCHSPGDIDGLCRVASSHGVPIVFDSVDAQGATYRGKMLGGFGRAEVFSLHATKLINGFEGGYVTTDDDDLAARLRWQRDFCIPAARPATVGESENILGINAKLNELHAAMALLSLDRVAQTMHRNREQFEAYAQVLGRLPGLRLLSPLEPGERCNHSRVVAEIAGPWPLSRDQTVAVLRAEGAALTPYYCPALHRSDHACRELTLPELPVTDALEPRFLQLPAGELVSADDIAAIGRLLAFLAENGAAVAARLAARGIR